MATNTYALVLCTCCTVWNANRDASGCEGTCTPDAHPDGLMGSATVAGLLVDAVRNVDGEIATHWTRHGCDGCGSRLAGQGVEHTGTDA